MKLPEEGYISRAKFMIPILEKMHKQQKAWKEKSISAAQAKQEEQCQDQEK